jgi:hypothetical protein
MTHRYFENGSMADIIIRTTGRCNYELTLGSSKTETPFTDAHKLALQLDFKTYVSMRAIFVTSDTFKKTATLTAFVVGLTSPLILVTTPTTPRARRWRQVTPTHTQ